mmetsp:Transcript_17916/g.38121  ORF Transcript_17916/g.38121 Transcript_17916/m.38121 type:complete len:228 (+) Transcript_17916:68-751(+)
MAFQILVALLFATSAAHVWATTACADGKTTCPVEAEPVSEEFGLAQLRKSEVKRHQHAAGPTCFTAHLSQDTSAVAANNQSAVSSGDATISVTPSSVEVTISWTVPGITAKHPVIGLHIHDGSILTNGAILVGFCGQAPLPSFSGPCEQGVSVESYHVKGQACDIVGGPCANPNGTGTIEDAASALIEAAAASDAWGKYYINLHTAYEFSVNGALGLIRGQLSPFEC